MGWMGSEERTDAMTFERDLGNGWGADISGGDLELWGPARTGMSKLCGWVKDGDFVAAVDGMPVPAKVLLQFLTIVAEWEKSHA